MWGGRGRPAAGGAGGGGAEGGAGGLQSGGGAQQPHAEDKTEVTQDCHGCRKRGVLLK